MECLTLGRQAAAEVLTVPTQREQKQALAGHGGTASHPPMALGHRVRCAVVSRRLAARWWSSSIAEPPSQPCEACCATSPVRAAALDQDGVVVVQAVLAFRSPRGASWRVVVQAISAVLPQRCLVQAYSSADVARRGIPRQPKQRPPREGPLGL